MRAVSLAGTLSASKELGPLYNPVVHRSELAEVWHIERLDNKLYSRGSMISGF